ncbi:MAG: fibronectin type III domain-containing protein, partial [Gammaproteobacteria bacterium]
MTRRPVNHADRRTFLKNAKSVALQLLVVDTLAGCESSTSDFNPLRENWNLKRGPYVQRGTTDSILVVWQTVEATRGAVEFGLTEDLGTRVETSVEASSFALSLTGLSPDTYYYYRVYEGDRPVSELLRLHTNPGPETTDFDFLVFGDSGSGTTDMLDV